MVEPEDSMGVQDRWHPQSQTLHHHDRCADYVTEEEAKEWKKRMDNNPSKRKSKKKNRKRDRSRSNGLVRNPAFTGGSWCVVCRYHPDPKKRRDVRTNRYCRECSYNPEWPFSLRCSGYQKELHPRLCSDECFVYFHTTRIPKLDTPT